VCRNNVEQFDVMRCAGNRRWLSGNGLVLRCANTKCVWIPSEYMLVCGGVRGGVCHTDGIVITNCEGNM
jgi:hypothetical protein